MATLRDIARRTGTSVAVVSKVLNGSKTSAEVRVEVRDRILSIAKKLGYQPNPLAQGLAKGKTFTIGIVFTHPPLASMGNFMVSQVISGIWDKARKAGYNIFIIAPEAKKAGFFPQIDDLKGRVDGVIAMGPVRNDDKEVEKWNDFDLPLVLLGTHPSFNGNVVDYDNENGAYIATVSLIKRGHKRIAIVGIGLNYQFMVDRINGYKKALLERKIDIAPELIKLVGWRGKDGYKAGKELLSLPNPPTAFFICVGEHIRGIYQAVRESEKRVPDDIELLSFDKLPEDFFLDIPVNSLDTFPYKIGIQGTGLLLDIIEGKATTPVRIKVPIRKVISWEKKQGEVV
ncbi:MAG: LacI family DNA-binding transcriptional regulator [Candidatus Jordarchaeaceae archaeon]